jgi:phosphatidylserine synthase
MACPQNSPEGLPSDWNAFVVKESVAAYFGQQTWRPVTVNGYITNLDICGLTVANMTFKEFCFNPLLVKALAQ